MGVLEFVAVGDTVGVGDLDTVTDSVGDIVGEIVGVGGGKYCSISILKLSTVP